jgi:hypothetical protein
MQRLIGLLLIGFVIAMVTLPTVWVMRRFSIPESTIERAKDGIAMTVLAAVAISGAVIMVREHRDRRKARSMATPPPLPADGPLSVLPPPLPLTTQLPAKTSRRGCLIAAGVVAAIPVILIAALYWMASRYEKQPKAPGEGELRLVAYKQLEAFKDREGFGNTPEAEKLADAFARRIRLQRHALFSEGSSSTISLSQGHFLTYCSIVGDRCAFVVHVPQLRKYAPDAKVTMGELAWLLASTLIQESGNTELKSLAVGVRGIVDTDRVLLGTIDPAKPAMANVEQTKIGTALDDVLYPFFDWSQKQAPASQDAGSKDGDKGAAK